MEREQAIVATQIRLAEDLYLYIKAESERLGISMNAVMNQLMDDGRRLRNAEIVIKM